MAAQLRRILQLNSSGADVDAQVVKEKNAQIGDNFSVEGVTVYQDANGAPVEQLEVSFAPWTDVYPRLLAKTNVQAAALAVFFEYASLFPHRSGGQVVYLEQAFPKPAFLFATMYAFITVVFSFSSSNAVVLARYIYRAAGYQAGEWANKGLALASYTLLAFFCLISNKWSLRLMNLISAVKLIILVFIAITGFVVLGGGTHIKDPRANFRNSFDGITNNANDIVSALVNINFAYTGYSNAFNVVAEIKNPLHTLKRVAPLSLIIVSILYVLANVAYFAAVPAAEIRESGELAAAMFFEAVFGTKAAKGLPALIAVSAAGNIMAVIIGHSRMMRECARQGLVPWPHVWASTRPFGTPFAPTLLMWFLTVVVILALPFGDAFNFLVDLRSYPDSVFLFLMVVGIYFIRHRRKREGLPPAPFRAWHIANIISAAVCLFILVMPWYPPDENDYSFWYATYCAVGIGLLVGCAFYYFVWIKWLPKLKHYSIRTETLVSDQDGSVSHRLRKVPNAEVEEWDRTHDEAGNVLSEAGGARSVDGNQHLLRRVRVSDRETADGVVLETKV